MSPDLHAEETMINVAVLKPYKSIDIWLYSHILYILEF